MTLFIYSIRDRKVGCYGRPMSDNLSAKDELETLRRSVITNPEFGARMADAELYLLGEFDDETGAVTLKDKPEFVGDVGKFLEALKNGN